MAGLKINDIINQNKKPVAVAEKDMHPVVSFRKAQKIIFENLVVASEKFISTGYYLKLIRDNEMYKESGYKDVWEFAQGTYGIGKSTASRWMAMNDKYSVEGNSPYIQEKFKCYGKSQLQEMLYLTDEQMEQVEEGMTVKEIREIRKPEPVVEKEPEPETVATSQQDEGENPIEYDTNMIADCFFAARKHLEELKKAGFKESEYLVKKQKIYVDALGLLYYEKFETR